jgi:hypothetical protein
MKSSAVLAFALILTVSLGAAPRNAKPIPQVTPAAAKSATSPDDLPPLSYTCLMDPQVVEDKAGECPICKMTLVPIRLESVWTCSATPLAKGTIKTAPGQCPIDHTPLIQVIASVSWTCPGSDVKSMSPGDCADGTPRTKTFEARAHGNHNPQHGGSFFMAPDSWHHLEGALPGDGVFRVYLYDDFTKPLKSALFKAVKGRVVTEQTFDAATRKTTEVKSFPLVPVAGGRYFQARIGSTKLPASMTAKMQFTPDGPEYPFDFTFSAYTKDVAAPPTPTMTNAAPPAPSSGKAAVVVPTAPAPTPAPLTNGVDGMVVDPSLIPPPITGTVPELLAQLKTQTELIRGLIDKGSFGSIYVPAFQAKDIALALVDDHKKELPEDKQRIAEPAAKKLIRAAWLLDAFGDIGNKQQIVDAFAGFVEAAKDLQTSFPSQP